MPEKQRRGNGRSERIYLAELWFTLIISRCGDMSQGLTAAAVVRRPPHAPHRFSSTHKVIKEKAFHGVSEEQGERTDTKETDFTKLVTGSERPGSLRGLLARATSAQEEGPSRKGW